MSSELPQKVREQMRNAGLPTSGDHVFVPLIGKNKSGDSIIVKKAVGKGPKSGKRGYVDVNDRIWIKDRAHAGLPDHWDVQIDDGDDYYRVDLDGNILP